MFVISKKMTLMSSILLFFCAAVGLNSVPVLDKEGNITQEAVVEAFRVMPQLRNIVVLGKKAGEDLQASEEVVQEEVKKFIDASPEPERTGLSSYLDDKKTFEEVQKALIGVLRVELSRNDTVLFKGLAEIAKMEPATEEITKVMIARAQALTSSDDNPNSFAVKNLLDALVATCTQYPDLLKLESTNPGSTNPVLPQPSSYFTRRNAGLTLAVLVGAGIVWYAGLLGKTKRWLFGNPSKTGGSRRKTSELAKKLKDEAAGVVKGAAQKVGQ